MSVPWFQISQSVRCFKCPAEDSEVCIAHLLAATGRAPHSKSKLGYFSRAAGRAVPCGGGDSACRRHVPAGAASSLVFLVSVSSRTCRKLQCIAMVVAWSQLQSCFTKALTRADTNSAETYTCKHKFFMLQVSLHVDCVLNVRKCELWRSRRQVWAGVLGVDPGGAQLTCDYKTVPKPSFQDSVGAIVLRTCQVEGLRYLHYQASPTLAPGVAGHRHQAWRCMRTVHSMLLCAAWPSCEHC